MAHSFGMLMPASAAARITVVPSGTVTSSPSIVSVIFFVDTLGGRRPEIGCTFDRVS